MAYDERALRGIGGWLAFLIVVLGILSPLRILFELVVLWAKEPDLTTLGAGNAVAYRRIGTVAALARLAITLAIAWRLYAVQRPDTVRIAIIGLWAGSIGLLLIELLLLIVVAGFAAGPMLAAGTILIAQSGIFAAIWTLYLRRSRRVANTYTTDGDVADVFR